MRVTIAFVLLLAAPVAAVAEEPAVDCSQALKVLDASKKELRRCLLADEPCIEQLSERDRAGELAAPCVEVSA